MREMNDKLWNEIEQLRRDVERLKTQGGTGRWTAYTPTVTYGGGTTNPTSLTPLAKYFRLGNYCTVNGHGYLVRGSGNRSQIYFSTPFNHSTDRLHIGNAYCTFSTAGLAPCYLESNRIYIYNGDMIGTGGYVMFSVTYEVA